MALGVRFSLLLLLLLSPNFDKNIRTCFMRQRAARWRLDEIREERNVNKIFMPRCGHRVSKYVDWRLFSCCCDLVPLADWMFLSTRTFSKPFYTINWLAVYRILLFWPVQHLVIELETCSVHFCSCTWPHAESPHFLFSVSFGCMQICSSRLMLQVFFSNISGVASSAAIRRERLDYATCGGESILR